MLLLYHYIATVLFFLWLYTQFFVAIYTVFCGYIHSFLWLYNTWTYCYYCIYHRAKEQKIKI